MEGPDSHNTTMRAAPAFDSAETAGDEGTGELGLGRAALGGLDYLLAQIFGVGVHRCIVPHGPAALQDALEQGKLVVQPGTRVTSRYVAAGAAVVVLFALGPLRPGLETWAVVAIVAFSFPFVSFAATARGCAQGSERFDMVVALQSTEISCKVLSGTALVLLGFGVAGAVAGFLIGAVFAAALGFHHLVHGLGVRLRDAPWVGTELPALRIVGPMFGALLGLSLLLNLDLVTLKLLSDERALTGYYSSLHCY